MIFGICLEGLAFSFLGVLVNVPEKTEPLSWRGRGDEAASGVTTNNAQYGKNTNTDLFYFNALSPDKIKFEMTSSRGIDNISLFGNFYRNSSCHNFSIGFRSGSCAAQRKKIKTLATVFALENHWNLNKITILPPPGIVPKNQK